MLGEILKGDRVEVKHRFANTAWWESQYLAAGRAQGVLCFADEEPHSWRACDFSKEAERGVPARHSFATTL